MGRVAVKATDDTADSCQAGCVHPAGAAEAGRTLASPVTYDRLAALFGALADPTRARIVHMLLHHELCTCDIATVLGISDSAVSQHLRILRSLDLVRFRRAGKFVFYTLADAHISVLIQLGLTHQQHAEETVSAAPQSAGIGTDAR